MILLLSSANYDDVTINRYRLVNHELRITDYFAVYGDSAVANEFICFTLGGTYLCCHQHIDEFIGGDVAVRNVLETNAQLLARNLTDFAGEEVLADGLSLLVSVSTVQVGDNLLSQTLLCDTKVRCF